MDYRQLGILLWGLLAAVVPGSVPAAQAVQPTSILLRLSETDHNRHLAVLHWFEHAAAANGWVIHVRTQALPAADAEFDRFPVVAMATATRDVLAQSERNQLADYLTTGGGLIQLDIDHADSVRAGAPSIQRERIGVKQGRRLRLEVDAALLFGDKDGVAFAQAVRFLAEEIRWVRGD